MESKSSFLLVLCILYLTAPTMTVAQSPAAAPSPPAPTNVTKILEKSGQFTIFIRLMKATHEDKTLYGQLKNSDNAMTIFAPSDSAFSSMKSGTLNAISDQDKAELVQFHVIPQYLSSLQFQTVSNPVNTQAGSGSRLQLNITTTGNSVNISTGLSNASVSGTVYTDSQLAIYQVDKVLLPLDIFTPKPPPPAPAPEKSKKKPISIAQSPDSPNDTSAGVMTVILQHKVMWFCVSAVVFAVLRL